MTGIFLILLVLIVIALLFTGGGLLGWVLEGIAQVLGLLIEGWGKLFSNMLGCLFWIFIAVVCLLTFFS